MKLTTGFDFQGYFITDYIDVYFDEIVVGLGLEKAIVSSIDNLFSSFSGEEATEIVSRLNEIKAELRKRVITKAEKAGANALIGIDFESSRLGDLIMVSMTATAVKIDKIIEPLPLTQGAADKAQQDRQRREDEKQKAAAIQQVESERLKKAAMGQLYTINKGELLERLRQMQSVADMLTEVKSAIEIDPTTLSDEQMKTLESSVEIARLYGNSAGMQNFMKYAESFLGPDL